MIAAELKPTFEKEAKERQRATASERGKQGGRGKTKLGVKNDTEVSAQTLASFRYMAETNKARTQAAKAVGVSTGYVSAAEIKVRAEREIGKRLGGLIVPHRRGKVSHAATLPRAEREIGKRLPGLVAPGRPGKSSQRARVSDLGISSSDSSRWQTVAAIPAISSKSAREDAPGSTIGRPGRSRHPWK